jgi:uncharacterized UBP type Zn finger protein
MGHGNPFPGGNRAVDGVNLRSMLDMGFDREHAVRALMMTHDHLERAIELLVTEQGHMALPNNEAVNYVQIGR